MDARKLTEQEQYSLTNEISINKDLSKQDILRMQAVLMAHNGLDSKLIEQLTGYNKNYAAKLKIKFRKKGVAGLISQKKKPRSLLTKGQIKQIIDVVQKEKPSKFGINADFWSTSILAQLILTQYNVKYKSKTSYYLMFKKAGFTYHKPEKIYVKRDKQVIAEWKEKHREEIKAVLQDQNTIVLVEDEMILTTQTTTQKVWLNPKDEVFVECSNKRDRRCIYGFLNVQSGFEHAFKTTHINSEKTIACLESVGNIYKNKKIVIIWDNASWHRSKEIKAYLSATKHNFWLIALPPYSPDLNPQENVWKDGRTNITHNVYIDNIDTTTDKFVEYLNNTVFNYKPLDEFMDI